MDAIKNTRQLYCCCGCSLKLGCILIAAVEICLPILMTCSPVQQEHVVIAVNWLLYVSASALLIWGATQESPIILLSWIIYRSVIMVLTFAGFIYLMHNVYKTSEEKARLIIFFLISMIFYFAVNGYFWTIVYSYYMELKERNRRKNLATQPDRY